MTMKLRVISASTAVLILFGAPVVAQDRDDQRHGHRMFDRMDSDKSGGVSLEEFLGGTDRRFSRMDADGNGTVSETEVDAFIAKRAQRIKQRIMSRLDKDGDGSVTRAEYDGERAKRFARLDANGDGQIEKDEARKAFKRHRKHKGKRGELRRDKKQSSD